MAATQGADDSDADTSVDTSSSDDLSDTDEAPPSPPPAKALPAKARPTTTAAPPATTATIRPAQFTGTGRKRLGMKHPAGRVLGGMKRHNRILRDNIQGITKPAIRRLARRGGVKRMSGLVYTEARDVLRTWLSLIVRDAITYTEHARRRTVAHMDVLYSLKKNGTTLYGF